jgi:GDP-6-deoxy-D-talose 4-dehydrogenase
MRVLITGLGGFTGKYLSRRLRESGCQVFGLGKDVPEDADKFLVVDLRDSGTISTWLRKIEPTHIVHLAALSHVVGKPEEFYNVNVVGTDSLLEAVADAGLQPSKILVASSANIYGNAEDDPITETTAIRPVNHYAVSKAAMELALSRWKQTFPIIITRPFNYTGPGQSERFVYAKIVAAFRRREKTIVLGNVHVSRDLSDVRYVSEVYCQLLQSSHQDVTVNVCSGHSVSINEAIDILAGIAGYRPEIVVDPALVRPNEILSLSGSPKLLASLLGGLPVFNIEQTLYDMYSAAD